MVCVGLLAISILIVVILFGMATVQAVLYHARFRRRDQKILRIMVFLVWFCTFAQVACLCHAIYTYTIVDFFVESSSIRIPATLAIATLLGGVVHPLVQATLTFRMWKFNLQMGHTWWYRIVSLLCWTISAYVMGLSVFLSIMALFSVHDAASLLRFTELWRRWISSVLISTAVVDALISSTLCGEFFLQQHDSARRTVQLLNKLILSTYPTGALTCVMALAINILFILSMESFAWMAMLFILTNLYANTLLVLLNSRWDIDENDDDAVTLTTFRVSGSRPHSLRSETGVHFRHPPRQRLLGMPSGDTFNNNPTRPSSTNDYHNTNYSASGPQSSRPLNLGFNFDHPGSMETFHEGIDQGSFEMVPLRSPKSAVLVDSPRNGSWHP